MYPGETKTRLKAFKKYNADETHNQSIAHEVIGHISEVKQTIVWDDFGPEVPQGHAQSAYIQGRVESGRRDYLPTNLKSKIAVKGRTTEQLARSQQPRDANQSGADNSNGSVIFQAFFNNVEKMKGTSLKTKGAQVPAGSHRKSRSFLNEKAALVIPKDPNTSTYLNKKVGQKIISSLLGPEDPAPVAYQFSSNIEKKMPVHRMNPVRESGESFTRTLSADASVESYIKLGQFPLYAITKNLLYLKASSLFNDTILFENDSLSLFCRTDKRLLADTNQVVLVLTFKPKVAGTNLITFLETEGAIRVEPENLLVQDFSQPAEQSIYFAPEDRRLAEGFPVINVTVGPRGAEETLRIVLPFTINKYLRGEPLSLDQVMRYLETVG